jgi:hypothetical protein
MTSLDKKVLKKKKLDKELNLKVSRNESNERIYVEFSSKDGKLFLERNFQDTYYGRLEAGAFEESFKDMEDFKSYFDKRKSK